MQFVPLVLFVALHLKNCFLLPSCHLTLMSFCTQGLPGVAEPIFSISRGKPFNQMDSFSKFSINPQWIWIKPDKIPELAWAVECFEE